MKPNILIFLVLAFSLAACQSTAAPAVSAPPLRDDPAEQIISDLEEYIPTRMQQSDIPGLTIALLQDHTIIWTEGFGVSNQLTGQPMQADAVFEVASLSKVMAAYTALQMTGDGQLSLEEPVYPYLPQSWMPGTRFDSSVTLHHLLTHTAGIFNRDEEPTPPGESFYYTGYGYARVQRMMENKSGQSLEKLAQEYTFAPLEMTSTSYNSPTALAPRLSNGHVRASYALVRFLVPATAIFIAMIITAVLLLRLWKKKWICPPVIWVLAAAGATTTALLGLWYLYHWSIPKMGRLMMICALCFEALLALLLWAGLKARKHLPPAWQTIPRKWLSFAGFTLLPIALLIGFAGLITIPTPKGPARYPSAAGSMWSNASDLSTLMIELSQPQHLPEDIACQMCTPQIHVNPDISWGLGIGIQHSENGDSLWHTGVHFDFTTLAVIYPQTGNGVVILANTNHDEAALRDIARLALGGKTAWEIPREAQPSTFMPEGSFPK
ncbi:MAG: beta-lactamase family protein [Anaerolineaceae bacterium]|nr:beta-lactamase family protein [Anaerolineaceae bacterium]